jgi:hypothetical protein
MVYLEPGQHRALKAEATRLGVSLAELMRRVVGEHLQRQQGVLPPVPKSVYLKIIGLGSSGRSDVSERHDEYLGEALRREHAG